MEVFGTSGSTSSRIGCWQQTYLSFYSQWCGEIGWGNTGFGVAKDTCQNSQTHQGFRLCVLIYHVNATSTERILKSWTSTIYSLWMTALKTSSSQTSASTGSTSKRLPRSYRSTYRLNKKTPARFRRKQQQKDCRDSTQETTKTLTKNLKRSAIKLPVNISILMMSSSHWYATPMSWVRGSTPRIRSL